MHAITHAMVSGRTLKLKKNVLMIGEVFMHSKRLRSHVARAVAKDDVQFVGVGRISNSNDVTKASHGQREYDGTR